MVSKEKRGRDRLVSTIVLALLAGVGLFRLCSAILASPTLLFSYLFLFRNCLSVLGTIGLDLLMSLEDDDNCESFDGLVDGNKWESAIKQLLIGEFKLWNDNKFHKPADSCHFQPHREVTKQGNTTQSFLVYFST